MTMLRLAAGGLLSLTATVTAVSAAEPVARPWYAKLTPGAAEPPEPAPEAPPRLKTVGPLDAVARLEAVKAEQAACDRRLEVCRKLREIALANNDEALSAEAEELERQTVALFQQRVARFGGKAGWKLPEHSTAASAPVSQQTFKVVTP